MQKALFTLLAIAMLPASAFALDAKVERDLSTDAKTAWAAVGDFCGIEKWHPAVAKCTLSEKDGKTFRELTLGDGAKILERLESRNDGEMSYTYSIVESPLPVKNYMSTISVKPTGGKSKLSWVGKFDSNGASDEKALKIITGIYEAGAVELAKTK